MEKSILSYLEKTESNFPDKVSFADKDNEITYKELVNIAKSIGSAILQKVGAKKPIIVCMEKDAMNEFRPFAMSKEEQIQYLEQNAKRIITR